MTSYIEKVLSLTGGNSREEALQLIFRIRVSGDSCGLQPELVQEVLSDETPLGDLYQWSLGEDRRKDGAHYTPDSLAVEVVRAALEPAFASLWKGDPVAYEKSLLGLRVLDPAMGAAMLLVNVAREIAREIAWVRVYGEPQPPSHFEWITNPDLPWSPELQGHADDVIHEVIANCCYGVDLSPVVVDIAKYLLWEEVALRCQVKPEKSFLDSNLRCGNSLLHVNRDEVEQFRLELEDQCNAWDLLTLPDVTLDERWLWDAAFMRTYGILDVDVGYADPTPEQLANRDVLAKRASQMGVFHWEFEFPKFHVIVANPPFIGDRNLRAVLSESGVKFISRHLGHTVDLCSFFIRAFDSWLDKRNGVFGVIATNSIAEGKNRRAVLVPMLAEGQFEIYRSCRTRDWPGEAMVSIATVHARRTNNPELSAAYRRIVQVFDEPNAIDLEEDSETVDDEV